MKRSLCVIMRIVTALFVTFLPAFGRRQDDAILRIDVTNACRYATRWEEGDAYDVEVVDYH